MVCIEGWGYECSKVIIINNIDSCVYEEEPTKKQFWKQVFCRFQHWDYPLPHLTVCSTCNHNPQVREYLREMGFVETEEGPAEKNDTQVSLFWMHTRDLLPKLEAEYGKS